MIGRMAMWMVVAFALLFATGLGCSSDRAPAPRRDEPETVSPPSAADRRGILDREIDRVAGGNDAGNRVRSFVEANASVSVFTPVQQKAAFLLLKRHGVDSQKAALALKGAEDLAAAAGPEHRDELFTDALVAFARVHETGRLDEVSFWKIGIKSRSRRIGENEFLNLIMRSTGEKAIGQRGYEAYERERGAAR